MEAFLSLYNRVLPIFVNKLNEIWIWKQRELKLIQPQIKMYFVWTYRDADA